MALSIFPALTALPATTSRVSVARVTPVEEVSPRSNASNRSDQAERVIEGELLQGVSRADFTIDDIVGVQTDISFDPRFSQAPGVAATVVAANDAVAAYISSGAVFTGVQRQVDTFV
ncbi:MAG: hypothetical protein COB94_009050 [Gammaproteobacteria bacterium]|nr:hypothetical protein [Gammaproteobacteria bacterium]